MQAVPPTMSANAQLLDGCRPYALPSEWDFLGRFPADAHRPPTWPDRVSTTLLQSFGEELLLRAGIFVRRPDGSAALAPALTDGAPLVGLRCAAGQPPFDFLIGADLLSGSNWPVFSVLNDRWTADRLGTGGVLLAASTTREVALLRALDLPATVLAGLDRPDAVGLRHLAATFAGGAGDPSYDRLTAQMLAGLEPDEQPASHGNTEPTQPSLVLVGWSPSPLDGALPDPVAQVVAALSRATEYLVNSMHVRVWRPPPQAIGRLDYLRQLRDRDLVSEWFTTSLHEDLWELSAFREAGKEDEDGVAPVGLQVARSRLGRALADWSGTGPMPDRARLAYGEWERALQQAVLAPLRQHALDSNHAGQRLAGLELADLAACQLLSTPILQERLRKALLSGDNVTYNEVLREIDAHLKITDRCRRLSK